MQMITKSCWNGAASGRFSGVGRSVPYAMGVFGNQRELAGNDAFPCGAGRGPPPTRESKVSATTRASGAQRSGRERWVEIAAEITPKGASNAGQSLSQPAADSSLYTREPCPTGDGGSGRRGRRPLRNETEARCDCPGQRSERGKSRWSNSGFAR